MGTSRRLPDLWVQKIFATLQGNYGSRFINIYKTGQQLPDGRDAGIVNAMNTWADKLGGYRDNPETFEIVLDSLPTDPPVLPVFRELMRLAHVPVVHEKIERIFTDEEIAANKKRMAEAMKEITFILSKDKRGGINEKR